MRDEDDEEEGHVVERSYSARTVAPSRLAALRTASMGSGRFGLLRPDPIATSALDRRSDPPLVVSGMHATTPVRKSLPPLPAEGAPSSSSSSAAAAAAAAPSSTAAAAASAMAAAEAADGDEDDDDDERMSPTAFTQIDARDVVYRQRTSPKRLANRYLVGNAIGQGSFSRVREAYDIHAKKLVALKIFTLRFLRRVPGGEAAMQRELWALKRLPPHPNLVGLHDFWADEAKGKNYLALDYIGGGTLKDLIDRAPGKRLPVSQIKILFLCLVNGLAFMHRHGFFHRDLKLDNLMLLSERTLVITDFGSVTSDLATEGVGAPAFQPPEVARDGKAPSSAKLDVWAAGITLYILATGNYPFNERGTAYQLFEEIANSKGIAVPPFVSDALGHLLGGMLDPNPATRFSLEQVQQHPWLAAQEECLDPVCIVARPTVFTDENVRRFLREAYTGSRYALVPGDQVDADGDLVGEADVIDPTLRVNRRPMWCTSWCSVL